MFRSSGDVYYIFKLTRCTASPAPAAEDSGGFTCYYFELGFFVDPPAGHRTFSPRRKRRAMANKPPKHPSAANMGMCVRTYEDGVYHDIDPALSAGGGCGWLVVCGISVGVSCVTTKNGHVRSPWARARVPDPLKFTPVRPCPTGVPAQKSVEAVHQEQLQFQAHLCGDVEG